MILTFTEYLPPVTFKSGKTGPPRYKADGKDYVLAKGLEVSLNLPYECVVDVVHSADGKFTNHNVKSAVAIVPAAGPVSPSLPPLPAASLPHAGPRTPTPTPTEAAGKSLGPPAASNSNSWMSDAARQRLIVKQSCLGRAVEYMAGNGGGMISDVLEVADEFVSWVFKEEAYGLTENHEGGGESAVSTLGTNSAPSSPAAKALEAARQHTRDRRADYALEDAVCPNCGFKEALGQGNAGWFCSQKRGGCGFPPRGERLDSPITYGEWQQRASSSNLRRPDAPLVSPSTHPTR